MCTIKCPNCSGSNLLLIEHEPLVDDSEESSYPMELTGTIDCIDCGCQFIAKANLSWEVVETTHVPNMDHDE